MKKRAIIPLLLLLFASCDNPRLNFDKGIIPPLPVNFPVVNSTFDDYNSDLDIIWTWKSFSLIFSTNRNSGGNDFDFISYKGRIESDLVTGAFEMTAESKSFALINAVNSAANELGPCLTRDYDFPGYWDKNASADRFFYTTDMSGSMDICCSNYTFGEYDFLPAGDPAPVAGINTEHNEGYLTIHYGESGDREVVYFTSDRDGSYNIYRAEGDQNKLIDQSAGVTVTRVTQLSSSADDKCPYICGNVMIFTSDRTGGFGGFDLWYSLWDGQGWSAPVNFGAGINTEYNEYRPVVISTEENDFLNDLMIFSSDRPGGYGGFDLYYVGIKRR